MSPLRVLLYAGIAAASGLAALYGSGVAWPLLVLLLLVWFGSLSVVVAVIGARSHRRWWLSGVAAVAAGVLGAGATPAAGQLVAALLGHFGHSGG